MNQLPQYNPNPNVPVGQHGNMQSRHPQQMQYSQQQPQQQPQQQQSQQRPQHYVFLQPNCRDSGEFSKLLQFSQVLNSQFQRIDVTVSGQKVPPNVHSTPSIAIYPDYKIKNPNESFRWLQQAIINEQRQRNPTNQPQQIQHPGGNGGNGGFPTSQHVDRPGNMGRVNMPVYNPDIGGGAKQSRMQSNPSGKEPSQNFNTYDPNRDTVRPFMSDMDSHGGGGFAYLNTDQPPPLDYAHIPKQQGEQSGQMQTRMGPNGQPMFTASQPGRPQKLPENKYQAYLESRYQDPYIQQQMSQPF
jgi:hypothetical protein